MKYIEQMQKNQKKIVSEILEKEEDEQIEETLSRKKYTPKQ